MLSGQDFCSYCIWVMNNNRHQSVSIMSRIIFMLVMEMVQCGIILKLYSGKQRMVYLSHFLQKAIYSTLCN
ncbi:hypothetical protein AQUCO_00900406v1 [Aquilegia coerulea]|uniref:Uncharacterized protein n=1 Tax=Aquilegia coerulea TaxID=218851 RepID=A0A2G5EDI4_AQUCA|nr:hypothetical protein AQUCO_00900406v1 [Aquilegia coerulea]